MMKDEEEKVSITRQIDNLLLDGALGRINLEGIGLKEFPRELFQPRLGLNLKLLNLSRNNLSTLPEDLPAKLPELATLFLSNNSFSELPLCIGRLKKLFMVAFKSNKISSIPAASLSPSIGWLILTDNQIKSLPPSIGDLVLLQKCMLSSNRLQSLPVEMKKCKNLELIRLSNNRFTELPLFLLDSCPKLSWVALAANPALEIGEANMMQHLSLAKVGDKDISLGEILGTGASGNVYQATWNGKQVAAKVYQANATSDGLPKDEMNAMIKMGVHPNVLSVLALLERAESSAPALLLPLIPPNYKILGNPPSFQSVSRDCYPVGTVFSIARVCKILLDVASVLTHLHSKNLTHGDLYAHNILIDDDQHLYLTDFGAAWDYSAVQDGVSRQKIEASEVCAFGWLVGELKSLVEPPSHLLDDLFHQCTLPNPLLRPSFSSIHSILESLLPTSK